MIILDKPFVSDFLLNTAIETQIPVLDTPFVRDIPGSEKMNLLEADDFFRRLESDPTAKIYSNSEDSAAWIYKYMPDSTLAENIKRVKDKFRMREIFASLNPEFYFQKCSFQELEKLDVSAIPKPFIVKPVRGIASIGIRAVFSDDQWPDILNQIRKDRIDYGTAFSDTVVDLNSFLLEGYIDGQEIAVDAYFDNNGDAVVVNILKHDFASLEDNSDRLYYTSFSIIKEYLPRVEKYLGSVANALKIRNFPMHMEMRITPNGEFIPIEINPMRFAGFCTTDMASYAFGINPYRVYLDGQKPNWNKIFSSKEEEIYSMGVVDIPRHMDKNKVYFDYDALAGKLENILEIRKMNYKIFPMAAFIFAATKPENSAELHRWLHDDMKNVIIPQS